MYLDGKKVTLDTMKAAVLLLESRDATTTDMWRNCCRHVQQLEAYWRADGMLEDIDPVVVSLQDSSSDSDSDEE